MKKAGNCQPFFIYKHFEILVILAIFVKNFLYEIIIF